jgi:hypothetical protein
VSYWWKDLNAKNLHRNEDGMRVLSTRATAGFVLSLIAGVLILLNGVVWFVFANNMEIVNFFQSLELMEIISLGFYVLGAIAVAFAAMVLIGSLVAFFFKQQVAGGVLVIIFSIVSMSVGGGFAFGMAFGIIGGALSISKE